MLNSEQQKAVNIIDGPLLILAGAGSGKTHTLTERVTSMIKDQGITPASILCVTFTNKAAKEMRERIGEKLGVEVGGNVYRNQHVPFVATFHSMGVFMLRLFIDRIGYEKNFTIYDQSDSLGLIKEIIKDKKIDDKEAPARQVQYEISSSKNADVDANTYSSIADSHFRTLVSEIYPEYQRRLRANNAVDFDDILLKSLEILRQPEALEYFHDRFQYFCVDEYQDTNSVQYQIIQLLSQKTQNLCVVGDDWQGIYSWRGADISNIMNFHRDFPKAEVIKLEQNYRSTKSIINAANVVIQKNESALEKRMWTDNEEGTKIHTYTLGNEKDEASRAVSLIEGKDYNNWAMLYRTNGQSRLLEEALIRRSIPYIIYGGVKFYDRKEIKDILAYLKLVYTPRDSVSFKRVVNVPPRKIGNTTIERISGYAQSENKSLMEMREHIPSVPDLRNPGKTNIVWFYELMDEIVKFASENNVRATMTYLLEKIGYDEYLKENFSVPEHEARNDNISELKNLASRYDDYEPAESMMHFLEDIALITDQDTDANEQNCVKLMTGHSAKGLEFDNVILVGCEEGVFPHSRSLMDLTQLEEERRLWYVAMTRAKKRLYITRAKERYTFGNYSANPKSRFIDEIPEQYMEDKSKMEVADLFSSFRTETSFPKLTLDRKENIGYAPGQKRPSTSNEVESFSLGDRVRHRKFGMGTIVALDGDNGQVAFSGQIKTMNLKIAPISKV